MVSEGQWWESGRCLGTIRDWERKKMKTRPELGGDDEAAAAAKQKLEEEELRGPGQFTRKDFITRTCGCMCEVREPEKRDVVVQLPRSLTCGD